MASNFVDEGGGGRDLEIVIAPPSPIPSPRAPSTPPALVLSNSSRNLLRLGSCSGKGLLMSNSGKRMDQPNSAKKKYVRQVMGRHNNTELHLAAQKGDIEDVKMILRDIDEQMLRTLGGAEFDAEIAEIRDSIVNDVNDLGETALLMAAEQGHADVVRELLPYATKEGIGAKNRSGFDPLHIAANNGHLAIVEILLDHDPNLIRTIGQANATPLISAASRGHAEVVKELLSRDSSLLEISRSNGKNALHLAARQGHVDVVKALLRSDPQLPRKIDKKGQTSLHMAVKGVSRQVVKMLLQSDPTIVMLPDKFGNSALHVATRKKRFEIVHELLLLRDTNVNALTRDKRTALDIAEGLPLSEESVEIKECLTNFGAVRANELNQPRDELRKTVTEIKKDVHIQLEQARKTYKNMNGIDKELRKLHQEGIKNATNSVTVVASLFATVAFAAIFTLPGGDDDNGSAVAASSASFKIFFIANAIALFTSLAVVVVQITVVRKEMKTERKVVEVINKLMWLASVCTTVSFIASSFIIVGERHRWAAIFITVVGAVIMAGVLGFMTCYVVKSKKKRKIRKQDKLLSRARTNSWHHSDISDVEANTIYAL